MDLKRALFNRPFEMMLYLGLSIFASVFCWRNVVQYREGNKSYSVTQEHVTQKDWPTLVICLPPFFIYFLNRTQYPQPYPWPYVYGKHFIIETRVSKDKDDLPVALINNQSVHIVHGFGITLSELHLAKVGLPHCCFKMSPTWKGGSSTDLGKIQLRLSFKSVDSNTRILRSAPLYAFVTSEENSYGAAGKRWFDGKAKRLYLKHTYLIKVTDVTEYHHIESTCSKESYYECLAKRFFQYEGESNCTASQKCSPFTLPQIDGGTIPPVCQNDTQASCFGQVIERLRSDQEKHCKRSCRVKEFATELDTMDLTLNESRNEPYALEIKFGAQDFTRDVRSLQVMKNVKTEYWTFSTIALVGSVGGTLGIFIGFSFIKTSQWLLGVFSKIMPRAKN